MDELAKRFADLAEKYGPYVAEAAKNAARAEAYSTLAASVIAIIVSIAAAYGTRQCWEKYKEWSGDDGGHPILFAVIILALFSGVSFLIALWAWIDPWTWITINHPELWLAKRAFKL